MPSTEITAYLKGLDSHLATLLPKEALKAIAGERARVERVELALARWAKNGYGPCPTRFNAIELSFLDGELSVRQAEVALNIFPAVNDGDFREAVASV